MKFQEKVVHLDTWKNSRRPPEVAAAKKRNQRLWCKTRNAFAPALDKVIGSTSKPGGILYIRFQYTRKLSDMIEELFTMGPFMIISPEGIFFVNLVNDIKVELDRWILVSFDRHSMLLLHGHVSSNDVYRKITSLLTQLKQQGENKKSPEATA